MSQSIPRLNAALEGRYEIEREIGEGGMATVYLARDLKHNRNVALKVLKPELSAVVGADRFLAEIETTANLQHPHILPLFDSGESGGFLFYVMPYIEGETLRDRLDREKQLPLAEALGIATAVAGALQTAHDAGVIHRDIKPGNILLSRGEPLVADFGIALAVGAAGGSRLTETGLSVGTPYYMSPEQATGDQSVGAASDTYALACVLYEMLTGDPPYMGNTAQAVLGQIISGEPVSASKKRRSIPAHVDAAIRKALEKLPADRFTSAQEFAKALSDRGFRHGHESVLAGAGGRGLRAWAVSATGVAVLSTSALGWMLLRPEPPVPVSRQALSTQGWAQAPVGRFVAVAADGSSMVVPVGDQLGLKLRSSTEIVPIPGTQDARDVVYSPDGEWIAYSIGTELYKRPIVGGSPVRIAEDLPPTAGVVGLDWLDDGTLLYEQYGEGEGLSTRRVVRISEDGGEPLDVVFGRGDEVSVVWVRGFPGARGALVVACPGTTCTGQATQLHIVDLEDLTSEIAFEQVLRAWYAPTGHIVYVRTDGAVLAQRIDLGSLQLEGSAIPLFEGVRVTTGSSSDYADMQLTLGGTLLYVAGPANLAAGPETLVFVDRNGRQEPVPIEAQNYDYPRFSPDGSRLAFAVADQEGRYDLWVLDLERGSRSRITFDGNNRYYPVWTPEGDGVAVSDGTAPPNVVHVVDAFGRGAPRPLLERDGLQYPTSWSRDGTVLAFHETHPESGRDIWLLPASGDPAPFLATPFMEGGGVFSPNGRWIAFTSDKSGREEIYVQPHPGPGPEYTISTEGGTEPLWSPDGTELFYRGPDQLMSVAVEADGDLRAGAPRALFPDTYVPSGVVASAHDYDISPDGQRFVMISTNVAFPTADGPAAEPSVVLVENFFEELRQRRE